MKKCKSPKVVGATNKQPEWYKRLIPTRKTIKKWLKRLIKSFKIEISFGDTFKWIFFILIWITIFPGSVTILATAIKIAAPFL